MKRFHVHVSVSDLDTSIRFYSALFGSEPAVRKNDYAKWMLEDPRVNFAISQRGLPEGINHLGLQTDSDEELETLNTQLGAAELATTAETDTACCYARSNKYWVTDPAGIAWEAFHSLGTVPTFDGSAEVAAAPTPAPAAQACCAPAPAVVPVKIAVKRAGACCATGTEASPRVRSARAEELPRIVAMLEAEGLPSSDLGDRETDRAFFVAEDASGPAGAVALERHGDAGLLRSLVVRPASRGHGLATSLVDAAEARARAQGISSLTLLTETAAPFFAARGYRVIPRGAAPANLQRSAEFTSLCPASSTCMTKSLGQATHP